jgi:hypothetical protein
MNAEGAADLAIMDATEKMVIGHGISSPGEGRTILGYGGGAGAPQSAQAADNLTVVQNTLDRIRSLAIPGGSWYVASCPSYIGGGATFLPGFSDDVHVAATPTSTRPIPLSALRHQQQRIGLFVPR